MDLLVGSVTVRVLLPAIPGLCREWRGIFVSGGNSVTRVAVFIDYENTRFGAREVFGDPQRDPSTFGHVKPLRLALLLKRLGKTVDPARELAAVYVYRGRPQERLTGTSGIGATVRCVGVPTTG